jgi:hypothetical protein
VNFVLGAIVTLAVIAGLSLSMLVIRKYLGFRGSRVVTCPETRMPAGVAVDAWRATIDGILGKPRLRLQSCSRWPERAGCGEDCLREIERTPHGCLVRALLAEWYSGKSCVLCGASVGDINWHERRPALVAIDGTTHEWSEFAPEKLPEALWTHRPICWSCHVAQSFRRSFPELVTDRDERGHAGRA